jgi:hypothetical protein
LLNDATVTHYHDPVDCARKHIRIVSDQEKGELQFRAQARQQVKNLELSHSIESCGWLVGDQQGRPSSDRLRNRHPLLLAATQLMRIRRCNVHLFRKSDLCKKKSCFFLCAFAAKWSVSANHFRDLFSDAKNRIERRSRFLVNHRNGRTPNFLEFALFQR